MFFFPYRAQIRLHRLPTLTIFVCLLCVAVFVAQDVNRINVISASVQFCEQDLSRGMQRVLANLGGRNRETACLTTMLKIHLSQNPEGEISALAERLGVTPGVAHGDLTDYFSGILTDEYRAFRHTVPPYLTGKLQYRPRSWNPWHMLTAAVAHGSWWHLLGNLFFFFVFAATVELLLGPVLFLVLLVGLALGTHAVYSLAMWVDPAPRPTVGLSGVVMGVIALFTYFLPTVKVRCILWVVVFFRRFALPAWIIAAWFVGWDIYGTLSAGGASGVNFIAHLAGAALGLILGTLVFRDKRHWANELMEA